MTIYLMDWKSIPLEITEIRSVYGMMIKLLRLCTIFFKDKQSWFERKTAESVRLEIYNKMEVSDYLF